MKDLPNRWWEPGCEDVDSFEADLENDIPDLGSEYVDDDLDELPF